MSTDRDALTVYEGMDVYGSDNEKLGTVDRVEGNYIVAKKGWLFPTDYYIPADAVSSVTEDGVVLNVTKDSVLDQGWDAPPFDREGYDTTTASGVADNATFAGTTTGLADGTTGTEQPFDHRAGHSETHVDADETIRVPLAEEELTATRRPVERGEVRVEKDVIAEEQTLDVPVTEERVNVTRRTVDRDVDAGAAAFEEDTIDVPVRGEEVDVQKRARVREELEISKEAVEETQRVSDTVRREEARVTDTTANARNRVDEDPDIVDGVDESDLDRRGR